MKREGNILSAVIRNAWDGRILQVATKNSPAKASNAHISILGDITRDELHSALAQAERSNGFANRFLWLHVERCGPKPFGGKALDWTSEVIGLKSAVDFARKQGRVYMDDNARRMWYRERKGGATLARLALLYALLDSSDNIRSEHLKAAVAFWKYAEDSARLIFGGLTLLMGLS